MNPDQILDAKIDGLVQERHNPIANALELRLSCTKPSIWESCYIDAILKTPFDKHYYMSWLMFVLDGIFEG